MNKVFKFYSKTIHIYFCSYLPLNLVVIEESLEVGSCNRIQTDDKAVISTATRDGGSGGLACANPNTKRFNVFARLPQAIACFSVSPPAQPLNNYIVAIVQSLFKENCVNEAIIIRDFLTSELWNQQSRREDNTSS